MFFISETEAAKKQERGYGINHVGHLALDCWILTKSQ